MPSVDNWLNEPLTIVQNIYEKYGNDSSSHIRAYFKDKLDVFDNKKQVPSLNDVKLHDLPANCLVHYRCLIQDIFDPEFYLGAYEVIDKVDNSCSIKCGKYQDVTQCPDNCKLNLDSSNNVTSDRITLYCVPIPGESLWTRHIYAENSAVKCASLSLDSSLKRNIDSSNDAINHEESPTDTASMDSGISRNMDTTNSDEKCAAENSKMQKSDTIKPQDAKGDQPFNHSNDLNYPLSGETRYPCLVKVYDDIESYKVNMMVEFVGVFSADPALTIHPNDMQIDEYVDPVTMAFPEEKQSKCPPPSLVPRLHVITSTILKHNNPLLYRPVNNIETDLQCHKKHLLDILTHTVFGDTFAAEYFLCNLISSVYSRADVLPLGKCSINLINAPRTPRYAQLLHHLISNIMTQSHMIEMSLQRMNKAVFSPYKDYVTNRLKTGELQLAAGTHLIIDETALEPGHLDVTGVKNVTALGTLISWQKVVYDFSYHQQDFLSDVPVVVLSEGTSLLPADYRVPLAPQVDPTDLTTYFSELDTHLTVESLNNIRRYISHIRTTDFTMDSQVQQAIEDDFVAIRQRDAESMTVDDFHLLLNLVRLLSLSEGSISGTLDTWTKAKEMEKERKDRVLLLPRPTSS